MRKLLFFSLMSMFSITTVSSQGYWTQKQNFGGMQRCGSVGMATQSKGYVFGGFLGGYDHFKDSWEYNPVANTWLQIADFPGAKRRWLVGFVLNGKCYVGLGGFMNGPSNYTYYNDFYEFNPDSNTWTQKSSFPGTPRVSAFYFNSDNKGYVGGGLSGVNANTVLGDLWRYNPNTDTWIQKNNIACGARFACSYFSIGYMAAGKTVYVGMGSNGSTYLNDLWEYDIGADSWIQKASLPGAARFYAASFAIGNYGYVGSGHDGANYLQDFYQYDRGTNSWVQVPNLTGVGRCEPFSFFINDKGYVGTGLIGQFSYTNDLWEYTPSWYGVSKNSKDNIGLIVYPNPVSYKICVSISASNDKNIEIDIYNMNGELKLKKQFCNGIKEICMDCSQWAKGQYIVCYRENEKLTVKTIIKL